MSTLTLRGAKSVRTFIRLEITCSIQHSISLTQNLSPNSTKPVHRYMFTRCTIRVQKVFDVRNHVMQNFIII